MRWTFACSLLALAKRDPRVVLLMGDVGGGLFQAFQNDFPNRYFNLGTAEQSLVGIAAGMAHAGMRPVVYTFTTFLLERAFEQIKLNIDHDRAPVLLVGWNDATQGVTHAPLDAETMLGCFRNLKLSMPANKAGVLATMNAANPDDWPAFLMLRPEVE